MRYPKPKPFIPKHPEKYKGDPNNIIARSHLEYRFFTYFDESPSVLEYASEEFYIPYYDPTTQKIRKYFIDLYIKVKTTSGEIKKYLIEIKPHCQTILPRKGGSAHSFKKKADTYIVNNAKWEATKEFCKKHNLEFQILTERQLP